MRWLKSTLLIPTRGKGLYGITDRIAGLLSDWQVGDGIVHIFCQHTSASLAVSENFDPTARKDLETFMEKMVPENLPWYTHTMEGPDDASSHIRAMITGNHLSIPVDDGVLSLGTWQGIFLFEHRTHPHRRNILLRVMDMESVNNEIH